MRDPWEYTARVEWVAEALFVATETMHADKTPGSAESLIAWHDYWLEAPPEFKHPYRVLAAAAVTSMDLYTPAAAAVVMGE